MRIFWLARICRMVTQKPPFWQFIDWWVSSRPHRGSRYHSKSGRIHESSSSKAKAKTPRVRTLSAVAPRDLEARWVVLPTLWPIKQPPCPPSEITRQAWGRHDAKPNYVVCEVPRIIPLLHSHHHQSVNTKELGLTRSNRHLY